MGRHGANDITTERPHRRPIALDLFSGAGGMSLGFERAGFDVLVAVDSDPVHLAVHERNFPQTYPLCADVSTVSAETLHAAVRKGWATAGREGEWDGTIDCIFGGPSCQGFSDMGRQREDDERNNLIFAFARVVRLLKPRSFVIENVPGLLFEKVRPKLDQLQTQLRDAGYVLQSEPPSCIDAADFGVPQHRRRVFLVGVMSGISVPRLPTQAAATTVADALDDLPDVSSEAGLLVSDRLVLTAAHQRKLTVAGSTYSRSLRATVGFEYVRDWDSAVLTGCQRTVHSAAVRARFARLKPGENDVISRTTRLDPSGRSRTLRAGAGRDHGSYTAPRPIHHRQNRVVTVREAARLHSFPDWFDFNVAKWHALREIGNAVPPKLAHAVADTVVEALGVRPAVPSRTLALGSDSLLGLSLGMAADYFGVQRELLPKDVRRRPAPTDDPPTTN